MARTLDELPVHQQALNLCTAVNAILDRPAFVRNCRLRDQIREAMDSVLSNMAEGFEQPTDTALMRFLFISKGSAAEVRTRVQSAHRRRFITADECFTCTELATTVEKMLGGWIRYLAGCGWTDRGRHGLSGTTRENRDRSANPGRRTGK